MKKKLLSVLLTMGMAISLFAGCGGAAGEGGNNAGGTQAVENGGAPVASSDDVYHMVWQITTFGFDDPDLGMIQDKVNEITVPQIGVEVEFKTVAIGEMATALSLAVSAGEQIDLVQTGLLITPAILQSQGLLQDITDLVEASPALMDYSKGISDACKVGGRIYAVPGSNAPGVQTSFMYDSDLAAEYNIQVPERLYSPEKWEALFEQIKASGMEQYGISLGDGMNAEYQQPFDFLGDGSNSAYYGAVKDGDTTNTIVNYYATEEYANKCKLRKEWYDKGYAVPDSISNGYTVFDSMTQGAIFGFVTNDGMGSSAAYWSKITGKNLVAIPMKNVGISAAGVVNFSWGVSTSCENPEKVIKFLELLNTDIDLMNIMNLGIEGKHYVSRDGSLIVDYPEGIDSQTCGYGNFIGTYGDSLKAKQRTPMTDEIMASATKFAYPEATSSPYLAYAFDTTPISTQLANVQAVVAQYAPALECGTVNPDEMIPQFIKALEDAGMNDVIAENQKQLNEFLAAQ